MEFMLQISFGHEKEDYVQDCIEKYYSSTIYCGQ